MPISDLGKLENMIMNSQSSEWWFTTPAIRAELEGNTVPGVAELCAEIDAGNVVNPEPNDPQYIEAASGDGSQLVMWRLADIVEAAGGDFEGGGSTEDC